ncbi:MAG TPA: hypothetical protein VJ983_05985 [candidate division Zixibacteria bacterium]|nr:hypothetical protein [candidate division Zixibacteria bacterium]
MKLEGDYLYPETPEEAIAFLSGYFEQKWDDEVWHKAVGLQNGDCSNVGVEALRIPIQAVREAIRYQEGEPWCGLTPLGNDDYEILEVSKQSGDEWSNPFPTLHKRAIYLVNNADEFRDLYEWLKE